MTTHQSSPKPVTPTPLAASLIAGLGACMALVGVARAETVHGPVAVTVTATACEPQELRVPAGLVVFQILNRSNRALEWEILKGVAVVDERENIAPGFRQKMTTRLEPGEYEITCGLLSNPRGRLIVVNAEGTTNAVPTRPTAVELVGPVAEYRVWIAGQLGDFSASVRALEAAVAAGDRDAGRARWVDAVSNFSRLAPAGRLAEAETASLEKSLAAIAAVLSGSTADDGGAAKRLVSDAEAFRRSVRSLTPSPDRLIGATLAAAKGLADAATAGPATGGDLVVAQARFEGVAVVIQLFTPLLTRADAAAGATLVGAVERLRTALAHPGATGGGAGDAATLSAADREAIGRATTALSDAAAPLPTLLGL